MGNLDLDPNEWLRRQFEHELCPECGGDADGHTAIAVMGNWFAFCSFADKLKRAEACVRKAQNALGGDLGGRSVTDLLADNFTDWSLDECRNIANQLGA